MKETRAGSPVAIGGLTVIPLEEVSSYHGTLGRGLAFFASRRPIGVIVSSAAGKRAIDVNGADVPLETYTGRIEGLQELLDGL
jgi:hypothetical protein